MRKPVPPDRERDRSAISRAGDAWAALAPLLPTAIWEGRILAYYSSYRQDMWAKALTGGTEGGKGAQAVEANRTGPEREPFEFIGASFYSPDGPCTVRCKGRASNRRMVA